MRGAVNPQAKFEVATIKRCTVDPGTFGGETSRVRITFLQTPNGIRKLLCRSRVALRGPTPSFTR
jgi:hypothetical protein